LATASSFGWLPKWKSFGARSLVERGSSGTLPRLPSFPIASGLDKSRKSGLVGRLDLHRHLTAHRRIDGDIGISLAELPVFVAESKAAFEPWQLAEHLEKAREIEPFNSATFWRNDKTATYNYVCQTSTLAISTRRNSFMRSLAV
jgi:hypothetical protein